MFARNLVTIFAATTALLSGCAANSCDELAAKEAIVREDFQEGFRLLQECESKASLSAETLMLLAYCYADESLVQDRHGGLRKSWELVERAALTGNEDAIVTMASMYLVGDEELGYKPVVSVADCLLEVSADKSLQVSPGVFDSNAVSDCLYNSSTRQ